MKVKPTQKKKKEKKKKRNRTIWTLVFDHFFLSLLYTLDMSFWGHMNRFASPDNQGTARKKKEKKKKKKKRKKEKKSTKKHINILYE
jgi:hypothetical protein